MQTSAPMPAQENSITAISALSRSAISLWRSRRSCACRRSAVCASDVGSASAAAFSSASRMGFSASSMESSRAFAASFSRTGVLPVFWL
jgi:hypothetical protein